MSAENINQFTREVMVANCRKQAPARMPLAIMRETSCFDQGCEYWRGKGLRSFTRRNGHQSTLMVSRLPQDPTRQPSISCCDISCRYALDITKQTGN